MKRFLSLGAFAAAALVVASSAAHAQDLASRDARSARVVRPGPGGILTAPSTESHGTIVADFMRGRGTDAATAASLRDASERRDAQTGLSQLEMTQEVDGLQVYGAYAKATFNDRSELVHLVENVSSVTPGGVVRASIGAAQALRAALAELYPNNSFNAAESGRNGNTTTFGGDAFFFRNPTVTAVAVPMTDNVLRAGYLVETWSRESNDLFHTVVAGNGRVLSVESRTNRDSYSVFTTSPGQTAQAVVSGPGSGNAQSPSGWLSGAQTTVNINGNNAHAYLDANNNNAPDTGGTSVTNGNFLTAANLTAAPTTSDNRNVAVQNLFFLNNVIHDRLYQHGFNEAAGNFQSNNFGNGGSGNDAVNAEAQDGGGVDNANFATPAEGSAPRMQMYLWTGLGDHEVVIGAAHYLAAGAAFGAALTTTGLSGPLQVATPVDACTAVGSLTGKVAIVDRGTCDFVVKVRNAQNAGAVAVIVANNVSGAFFTMGGSDRKVRIPSVMVSQASGVAIKAAAGSAATVRKNPVAPVQLDGSVDADIVYHEYCHGLTWRMIGSMSGALPGAIGEGMGDVCAILMNGDDRMGEYSASDPNGIRRNPYTNYPRTYANVTGAEVHDDGELYAAIGWRLKENFEGNGRTVDQLFDYLVGGMNFTAPGPYFEDMRDGILDHMDASGHAADKCLVWDAFADFGVGVGAQAALVFKKGKIVVNVTQSFSLAGTGCAPLP